MQDVKRYSTVLGLALLYFAINIGIHIYRGHPLGLSFIPYFKLFIVAVLPLTFVIGFPLHVAYILIREKPARPLSHVMKVYSGLFGTRRRWINIALSILVMMLAFSSYTGIKAQIPLMMDYKLDELFMRWDFALHGGRNPFDWLEPIFRNEILVSILDRAYVFWFVVMFAFWSMAALHLGGDHWRHQFILAFVLTWMIGGNLLAALLYSMGPTYYDLVGVATNPYGPQMTYLENLHARIDLLNIRNQGLLEAQYLNPVPGGLGGISAMPSLHNATSALFMLAAFRINRKLGWVFAAYLLIIVIGSVYFGWHYAIDAYFGIALALVLWCVAGVLLRMQDAFWKSRERDEAS